MHPHWRFVDYPGDRSQLLRGLDTKNLRDRRTQGEDVTAILRSNIILPNVQALIKQEVINEAILLKNCPLDHGYHSHVPNGTLGMLEALPTEVQHGILGQVDVETLLGFRRVSRRAMAVVDGMLEWKKIMVHAPDTLRMAVGIGTASTFTIGQLHNALCETKCSCGFTAPYIDLFTLTRRCVELTGYPQHDPEPHSLEWFQAYCPEEPSSNVPSFRAIMGKYADWDLGERRTYYKNTKYPEEEVKLGPFISRDWDGDMWTRRLACVVAPWLNKASLAAEDAIICQVCYTNRIADARAHELFNLRVHCSMGFRDVSAPQRPRSSLIRRQIGNLFTERGLKEHMKKEHMGDKQMEKELNTD